MLPPLVFATRHGLFTFVARRRRTLPTVTTDCLLAAVLASVEFDVDRHDFSASLSLSFVVCYRNAVYHCDHDNFLRCHHDVALGPVRLATHTRA